MLRKEKGITLVALIITIIVLLILAGVTLMMVIGPNGVVEQTQNTKTTVELSTVQDTVQGAMTNVITEYNKGAYIDAETGNIDISNYIASAVNESEYNGMMANVSLKSYLPEGYTVNKDATSSTSTENAFVKFTISIDGQNYNVEFNANEQKVVVTVANNG